MGGFLCGRGLPVTGAVRDLRGKGSSFGGFFDWEVEGELLDARWAVTLDGDLVGIVPAGQSFFDFVGMQAGERNVEVHALRAGTVNLPDYHWDDRGRRVYLVWPPSGDEDARAYRVYWNEGALDNPTELLDEVTGTELIRMYGAGCSSGTGTGRLTVSGAWSGMTPLNKAFLLRIGAGNTFQHTLPNGGEYGALVSFRRGVRYELPGGARVVFEDAVASYTVGDVFTIGVGVPRVWRSGDLAAGSYKFTVKPVDAAGNVGSAMTARTVVVSPRPEGVSGLEAAWDGTDIVLTWTPPAGVAGIRVYTNLSQVTGALKNYVIHDVPFLELAGDAEGASWTPAVDGDWRIFVRTVDGDGIESKSAEMVEINTEDLPTGVMLREPESVTVTPIAGGKLRVGWLYPWPQGGDVASFRVYENTDAEAPVFTTPAATVAAPTGNRHEAIAELSWDSGAFTTGAVRYYTVRSVTAAGVESKNAELVAGTADATAPGITGRLLGVPN